MSTSIITAALSAQKSVVSDSKKLDPYSSLEDEDEGGGWANWWCGVKKGGGGEGCDERADHLLGYLQK